MPKSKTFVDFRFWRWVCYWHGLCWQCCGGCSSTCEYHYSRIYIEIFWLLFNICLPGSGVKKIKYTSRELYAQCSDQDLPIKTVIKYKYTASGKVCITSQSWTIWQAARNSDIAILGNRETRNLKVFKAGAFQLRNSADHLYYYDRKDFCNAIIFTFIKDQSGMTSHQNWSTYFIARTRLFQAMKSILDRTAMTEIMWTIPPKCPLSTIQ